MVLSKKDILLALIFVFALGLSIYLIVLSQTNKQNMTDAQVKAHRKRIQIITFVLIFVIILWIGLFFWFRKDTGMENLKKEQDQFIGFLRNYRSEDNQAIFRDTYTYSIEDLQKFKAERYQKLEELNLSNNPEAMSEWEKTSKMLDEIIDSKKTPAQKVWDTTATAATTAATAAKMVGYNLFNAGKYIKNRIGQAAGTISRPQHGLGMVDKSSSKKKRHQDGSGNQEKSDNASGSTDGSVDDYSSDNASGSTDGSVDDYSSDNASGPTTVASTQKKSSLKQNDVAVETCYTFNETDKIFGTKKVPIHEVDEAEFDKDLKKLAVFSGKNFVNDQTKSDLPKFKKQNGLEKCTNSSLVLCRGSMGKDKKFFVGCHDQTKKKISLGTKQIQEETMNRKTRRK